MSDTQFNTLVQMVAELSKRIEDIAKNYATKDDLKQFATKEELKRFATKQDLSEMADTLLDAINTPFQQLQTDYALHDRRILKLERATKLV